MTDCFQLTIELSQRKTTRFKVKLWENRLAHHGLLYVQFWMYMKILSVTSTNLVRHPRCTLSAWPGVWFICFYSPPFLWPWGSAEGNWFYGLGSNSKNSSATSLCLWPSSTLSPCSSRSASPCWYTRFTVCLPYTLRLLTSQLSTAHAYASLMVYCLLYEAQGLPISSLLEGTAHVVPWIAYVPRKRMPSRNSIILDEWINQSSFLVLICNKTFQHHSTGFKKRESSKSDF